jgi:hypothetical protein
MAPVLEGQRTQAEAARRMILCVRQVRRLQRRLEKEGDAGVIHRLRGRPSNHRHPETLRRQEVAVRQAVHLLAVEPHEPLGGRAGVWPAMACGPLGRRLFRAHRVLRTIR